MFRLFYWPEMVLSFLQPPLRRLAGGLRGAGGGSRLLLLLQPGARRSEAFTHALFVRCELLHPLDRALELPPETQARGFTLHKPDPLSSCGAGKVVPASGYRSKGAYAAICTNVKDEGLNLVEFILYHEWVGFGKIYVMDYNSSRPLSNMRMLLPFIRSGLVEYHYDADPRHHSPRRGGVFADYSQGTAFQRCIDFAHRDHMWMAFIDADEYLIVRDSSPPRNSSAASPPPPPPPPPQAAVARPNISALLRHYEQYPGVGVNMRYFGSSGHVQRPTAGTLEAYTACSPAAAWDNRHIKTIARMSAVLAIGGNPHEFVYIGGGVAVNELGLPVQGPESLPVSWSRLALHHYVTRSLSEFLAKMRRGPGGSQNRRTLDWFRAYDGNATETCGEGPALWQACCAERYEALRAEWLAAAARGRARRRGGDGGA